MRKLSPDQRAAIRSKSEVRRPPRGETILVRRPRSRATRSRHLRRPRRDSSGALRSQGFLELLQAFDQVRFESSSQTAIEDLLRGLGTSPLCHLDQLAKDGPHVLLGDGIQHRSAERGHTLGVGVPRTSEVARSKSACSVPAAWPVLVTARSHAHPTSVRDAGHNPLGVRASAGASYRSRCPGSSSCLARRAGGVLEGKTQRLVHATGHSRPEGPPS